MILRIWHFLRYGLVFTKALVKANVDVTRATLAPRIRIRPGFLALKTEAATDLEITSLANSITLTPGTISVHIALDHKTLVIHALDVGDDPDAIRKDIRETLEANILKWTRPARGRGGAR